jgi:hypothetical protein
MRPCVLVIALSSLLFGVGVARAVDPPKPTGDPKADGAAAASLVKQAKTGLATAVTSKTTCTLPQAAVSDAQLALAHASVIDPKPSPECIKAHGIYRNAYTLWNAAGIEKNLAEMYTRASAPVPLGVCGSGSKLEHCKDLKAEDEAAYKEFHPKAEEVMKLAETAYYQASNLFKEAAIMCPAYYANAIPSQ